MKSIAAVSALLIASLPLLSACSPEPAPQPAPKSDPDASTPAAAPKTVADHVTKSLLDASVEINGETKKALGEARGKLDGENIAISGDKDGKPKAEISPQGDLLIEGRKVEVNAEQRALLMTYRNQIATIAQAGIDIGVQGADLGIHAAGEAMKSVFNGDTEGFDTRVEKQTAKIEASARKLCDQLPPMLATQQALAQKLPEFQPYATMDQGDIDDCRDGHHND